MIQVTDKSQINVYYFPKNLSEDYEKVELRLYNSVYDTTFIVDSTYTEYEPVNYYKFECDFSNVPDGEYTYKLCSLDGKVLSYGIIQIGLDYKKNIIKEYKC